MEINLSLPTTLAERAELDEGLVRIPASFEEFCALADVSEFGVEYHNNEIILMSTASDPHEQIVANLLYVLGALFKGNPEFKRYGSNRPVYLPEFPASYCADALVVRGTPDFQPYTKGKNANRNPWLVAEVLSPSTRKYDLLEKTPNYQRFPSLRYIVLVEQEQCLVTVFHRTDENTLWTSVNYTNLSDSFLIENQPVALTDVYENILFNG